MLINRFRDVVALINRVGSDKLPRLVARIFTQLKEQTKRVFTEDEEKALRMHAFHML
jgi:hypothetical protein